MDELLEISEINVGDIVEAQLSWLNNDKIESRSAKYKIVRFTLEMGTDIRTGVTLNEYSPKDHNGRVLQIHSSPYIPGVGLEVNANSWPVYSRNISRPLREGMIDIAVFKLARRKI